SQGARSTTQAASTMPAPVRPQRSQVRTGTGAEGGAVNASAQISTAGKPNAGLSQTASAPTMAPGGVMAAGGPSLFCQVPGTASARVRVAKSIAHVSAVRAPGTNWAEISGCRTTTPAATAAARRPKRRAAKTTAPTRTI